jgi:hypothetical protein
MVNFYFLGDESVKGPIHINEWKGAIGEMKSYLGITENRLSPFIADVFLDVTILSK